MKHVSLRKMAASLFLCLAVSFVAVPAARAEDICFWYGNGCLYKVFGFPGQESELYMNCGDGDVYQGSGTWAEGACEFE